jgi:phage terminase Nu1 subunit (DNA packaging protein)
MTLALPISKELLDALTEQVAERLQEQRRWVDVEGAAAHYGVTPRRIRDWRERGMPGKKIGKRLMLDLHAVDEWLARQP